MKVAQSRKGNHSLFFLPTLLLLTGGMIFLSGTAPCSAQPVPAGIRVDTSSPDYQQYFEFFKEVYAKMNEHYYHGVQLENFKKFIYVFNNKIYSQLKLSGKSNNYIKWRSAAFLVDALRSPDDIFSKFYPPAVAKEFESTVLGKRIDLGIEGERVDKGYKVKRVQVRVDAYAMGLRVNDIITAIKGKSVRKMTDKEINDSLVPDEGAQVKLTFIQDKTKKKKTIKVVSKEYFKEFVFEIPVDAPDIYCLQIAKFNRTTGEDLERYMGKILENEDAGLIIDLRSNPGGPPLAAREISAFFLTPNEEFAYFQKRNRPKAPLYVPEIPEEYHFKGDMVILVNHKSGSASELFSGILQSRNRAVVMGTNTAGQVFLKSMFYFDDESMVALVTGRGFHPDGTVFPYDGVKPNEIIENQETDLIEYAADYLIARRKRQSASK